jgi:hypothetical protein
MFNLIEFVTDIGLSAHLYTWYLVQAGVHIWHRGVLGAVTNGSIPGIGTGDSTCPGIQAGMYGTGKGGSKCCNWSRYAMVQ